MSDTITDFYHQKTDAELLFFVAHPELYQSGLVDAARRELRQRGIAIPQPAVAGTTLPEPPAARPSGPNIGLLTLALGLVLVISLGLVYFLKQKNKPAPVAAAVPAKPAAPPKLTTVATSVIPSYDVAKAVAQQLRQVPATERANAQHLKQFRELAKRFWTAETQTEYLTNQAHEGKAGPMFAEQTLVVRETWRAWNHAAVYGYDFGPVMQEQFQHMSETASSQQHILESLPDLLPGRKFLTDKEINAREDDVQDWLSGLLPASPVTGRPYKATVRQIVVAPR